MPNKEGRTGNPGNSTEYHSIDIPTSKPELLQPGSGGRERPPSSIIDSGVPNWKKNKFTEKESGVKKRGY